MGKRIELGKTMDYRGYQIKFESSKVYKILREGILVLDESFPFRIDAARKVDSMLFIKKSADKCFRCGIKFFGNLYNYSPIKYNGKDHCEDCISKLAVDNSVY